MIFFFKCIRISRGTRSDGLFYEKITATPFNEAISVQYFQLDFQPLHPETKHRLIKIGSCNLSDIMIVQEVSNQFNRFQKPGLESYFLTLSRSFQDVTVVDATLVSYHFFQKTVLTISQLFCMNVQLYKDMKRTRRFSRENS